MNKYSVALFLLIIMLTGYISYSFTNFASNSVITKVFLNSNNQIVMEFEKNNIKDCYVGNNLDNVEWTNCQDTTCVIPYNKEQSYIYVKDSFGKIYTLKNDEELWNVNDIEINSSKIYLTVSKSEQIKYQVVGVGSVDGLINFKSDNKEIVSVTAAGLVTGLKPGDTKIFINAGNITKTLEVSVTDLLTVMPNEYNYDKKYLSCNVYTKEQNDYLDEVLADRVNDAGYKTRGATVAVARFLTMEFPYRISYFGENGRLYTDSSNYYVDGEGRYYHKGLYLNESRYSSLIKSMYGPGTWGCYIYAYPSHGNRMNGLDCSGFVTWVLYNAGFDPGDIGAGVTSVLDMTDLAPKNKVTDTVANNSIKPGDLLSGIGSRGGHIAIVAGMDDTHYYVAESLSTGKNYGPLMKTYLKEELHNKFYWHLNMDDYYGEEGTYTNYWNEV